MTGNPADWLANADRAAASGDLSQAQDLLSQAAGSAPDDVQLHLKLAAVSRAAGQPRAALTAVQQALTHSPLDFVALVMRASLLEALGEDEAGEAWSNALAQRPAGHLPGPLAAAVAQGEKRRDAWLSAREARMKAQMVAVEEKADAEERERIARFRSNALRRTRPYHSEPTHFHFPGLVEREFHPRRLFPWLDKLEAATDEIAAEFQAVMAAERAELVPYIQYAEHQPLAQWQPLNQSRDWTAIHLLQNGSKIDANAAHCPRTLALLDSVGQPAVRGVGPNAMFSLLAPNTAIPPHVGVNNTRLVCHLPLIVPDGCWFRVGAETRHWHPGEAFVFDDTIEHEARNPTDQLRVVFIFDIWHPGLSMIERQAATALLESEAAPVGGL
ncbi:MAG: aspartyl/asparaginyl beta-hydroxylase domain-containing protein [Sphingomicrobium sp.]